MLAWQTILYCNLLRLEIIFQRSGSFIIQHLVEWFSFEERTYFVCERAAMWSFKLVVKFFTTLERKSFYQRLDYETPATLKIISMQNTLQYNIVRQAKIGLTSLSVAYKPSRTTL
jgi:hypothetical protein